MRKKSVLVIDDDELIRYGLDAFLEREGFAVDCCENGRLALDRIKEKCFDVILIDYCMPEMNGDEVCGLLRPLCPEALIIGTSIEDYSRAFQRAGADFFVNKFYLLDLTHELVLSIRRWSLPAAGGEDMAAEGLRPGWLQQLEGGRDE